MIYQYIFFTKFFWSYYLDITSSPSHKRWGKYSYFVRFLRLPKKIILKSKIFVFLLLRVLLNRAPTSTQLHPPTPSSFQPPSSSLNIISTKISHVIEKFPQIYAEKFNVVHFDWQLAHMVSWRCWFQIRT